MSDKQTTTILSVDNRTRVYSLDFLKVIATIIIVFHHYQQVENVHFDGVNFCGGKFYFGYLVELFFLLSGFFMYRYIGKIREGMTFKAFFGRRYLRFLPMLALSAVANQVLSSYYLYITNGSAISETFSFWKTVTAGLGLFHGWVFQTSDVGVNNPLWYVEVLLICFVYFYVSTWFSRRLNTSPYWHYLFLSGLGTWFCENAVEFPYFTPHTGRGCRAFFFGIIIAYFNAEIRDSLKKRTKYFLGLLSGAIIVFVSLMIWRGSYFISDQQGNIMAYVFFPSMIYLFTVDAMSKWVSKIWGIIAKVSFHAYVWHLTAIMAMNILIAKGILNFNYATWPAMILFTMCLYGLSVLSYFAIEKKLLSR